MSALHWPIEKANICQLSLTNYLWPAMIGWSKSERFRVKSMNWEEQSKTRRKEYHAGVVTGEAEEVVILQVFIMY